MKVPTIAEFKAKAEELFAANENVCNFTDCGFALIQKQTRYSMKYRDKDVIVTLKVTDGTKTYTYDVVNKKELHPVTEINMRMMALMSGRAKINN